MLELIDDLPGGVYGIRASGKVSREDYERVVVPQLEQARSRGDRLRFLYQFGPKFDGFTPGAAWEDLRVGLQYIRLFDRCAVVTDVEWLRTTTRGVAPLMPCPVKVFGNADLDEAISWLANPREPSISYRVVPERRVLVIEPHGRLRAEDFDRIDAAADTWIESGDGLLNGVVVHAREFPGWENLGSLMRHIRFVRNHHRQIRRVALAVDGSIAQLAPAIVDHFVQAEMKQFAADDVEAAIVWAGAPPPGTSAPAAPV